MYEKHIALHEQDGYKAKKHTKCPIAAKLHGPIGKLQIRKVEWEPWEPSDIGIPQDMIDALDEAKNTADCINLARANHCRLDQDKSNIERQGHWPTQKQILKPPEGHIQKVSKHCRLRNCATHSGIFTAVLTWYRLEEVLLYSNVIDDEHICGNMVPMQVAIRVPYQIRHENCIHP